jgi:hypothetical protein
MKVFFHSGTCEDHPIFQELWNRLISNGLSNICLCVVGCNYSDKISKLAIDCEVNYHSDFMYGEFFTLEILQEYCRNNLKDTILYIHTKGIGDPLNKNISDWRQYMSYFCIDRWRYADMNNYDTFGVDWVTDPAPHYSGNFWISRCDYVASLPDIKKIKNNNTVLTKRHNAEFWIGMGNGRHHCAFSSGIPVHRRHEFPFPKNMYEV